MATADFSHLERMELSKGTIEYEILEVEGDPVLIGVFAGEQNKPYQNALLKRATRNVRKLRAGKMTAKELAANRDHDRELFPKFVLKDWRVKDAGGNDAEFTEDNCRAFLYALPDDLVDDVRNHFSNPVNFREEDLIEPADVEDLGNS